MARHVLNGELPAFFWGQAFKGVPEVYLSAGAFALWGSSVAVLKAVTLALFAAYVGMNFVLLEKMTSRWVAAAASSLLIAAPPALVFWSLDASAEYVVIMLLGTALMHCLPVRLKAETTGGERREQTAENNGQGVESSRLFMIGLIVGVGLWVHQLFIVYLIPLTIVLAARTERWKRREFGTLNRVALGLGAIAAIYLVLGIVAFVSGGFAVPIGSITISATAPQKMARIAVGILALAALVQLATTSSGSLVRSTLRRYWIAAAGFLVGYSPVVIYSVLVEPARSPARVATLKQLLAGAPDILRNIVPILAGFKIATTERLPLPLVAIIPGAAALAAYLWVSRRTLAINFFALFVVFFPLLFLASGAYLDTQSYRYFIPWYAGLSVAWAAGSYALASMVRLKPGTAHYRPAIASAIVAAIVGVHVWQQVIWYRKLQPDTQSLATIDCLTRNGIRGGYAEYWTAYKLTFLAEERIIIAPTDGIDRYPTYTDFVRSLPGHQQVRLKADTTNCMDASPP